MSSVIRSKDESQNEDIKKTKHAKFSVKRRFLTRRYGHVRFFGGKFGLFCDKITINQRQKLATDKQFFFGGGGNFC